MPVSNDLPVSKNLDPATDSAPLYINAESRGLQRVLVTSLVGIAAGSFALGFLPLFEVARWADLPVAVAATLPIVLDLGLVVSSLSAIVRRSRGQAAGFETLMLTLLAAVSVSAQIVHAYDLAGTWTARTILVALVLSCAPLITVSASHVMLRSLIKPPTKRAPKRVSAPQTVQGALTRPPKTPAAPQQVRQTAPRAQLPVPAREEGESDLAYAVRLNTLHGVGQRKAAELAGTTRSKLETALAALKMGQAA